MTHAQYVFRDVGKSQSTSSPHNLKVPNYNTLYAGMPYNDVMVYVFL